MINVVFVDLQISSFVIGFRNGYPFPHAHTLYIMESSVIAKSFKPEPLRAKMIMFTFADALARAKMLYGVSVYLTDTNL